MKRAGRSGRSRKSLAYVRHELGEKGLIGRGEMDVTPEVPRLPPSRDQRGAENGLPCLSMGPLDANLARHGRV
jgi:hypothetical protein